MDRTESLPRHMADTLDQRLAQADPALQAALSERLSVWRAMQQAHAATASVATPAPATVHGPGSQALAALAALAQARPGTSRPHADAPGPALRAVAPFRQAWAQVNARQRVRQGQRQEPANAGPLNPHKLAQRTLGLVDELSPPYLTRLVHLLDALMWLEQAPVKPTPRAGGAAPKTRAKRQ